MEKPNLDYGAAIKFGWKKLKKNAGFLIGIFIVQILVVIIYSVLSEKFDIPLAQFVLFITYLIIIILMSIGFTKIYLKIYYEEDIRFNDLFIHSRYFTAYFGATVIYVILVTIGFFILIIPGFLLALIFYFYQYFIVDQDKGIIESLQESYKLTNGYLGHLFVFFLIILALNILGFLVFLVGVIVTSFVSSLAMIHIYKQLQYIKSQ